MTDDPTLPTESASDSPCSPVDSVADPSPTVELTEAPTRRQKFWAFAFAATGFLTVYVLSAGPMVAIHDAAKFRPFQRALEIVYAPIVLIVKSRIEPFAGLLKAYLEIFH